MLKAYLEVGEVVAVHGVAGACRVYPWCDSPAVLTRLHTLYWGADGAGAVQVRSAGRTRGLAVLHFEGVDTVQQARALVGRVLYAARGDLPLPKGRYFVQDIVGCTLYDADTNVEYGTVQAVTHPANCDIYEVRTPAGGTVLFPAVEAFVAHTDVQAGRIAVRPIEGMFTP